MQKLTLKRKASGLYSVLTPDGLCVGTVTPCDFDLDDDEFGRVARQHGRKNPSKPSGQELVRQVNSYVIRSRRAR